MRLTCRYRLLTSRAGRQLEYTVRQQRFHYTSTVEECIDCYRKKVGMVALCDQQLSLTDCRTALHVCFDYGLPLDRDYNVAGCEDRAPRDVSLN